MNRLALSLLLTAGLFGLDVTPASAHTSVDRVHVYGDSHRYESRRHDHMPKWLKRDKHFRGWYRHTPLRHYRQLSWNQLYEIYHWERNYFLSRRNHDRHYKRYYDRDDDSDFRREYRRRH